MELGGKLKNIPYYIVELIYEFMEHFSRITTTHKRYFISTNICYSILSICSLHANQTAEISYVVDHIFSFDPNGKLDHVFLIGATHWFGFSAVNASFCDADATDSADPSSNEKGERWYLALGGNLSRRIVA